MKSLHIPLGASYTNATETISIPHNFHSYCLGKSGVGKSVYLGNIAEYLIGKGEGLTVIDPHSNLIDRLLTKIPRYRMEHSRHDVILLRASENLLPGINPFAGPGTNDEKVSAILDTFAKTFEGMWYESSDSVMRWACYAVLEQPFVPTFETVKRFLKDDEYMHRCLSNVTNLNVLQEFSGYDKREWKQVRAERIAPVLNKLDKFITNKTVRALTSQESGLDFRRIINEGKILLVDLSGFGRKEKVILGGLILNMLFIAAQTRQPGKGKHHSIVVDEAQTFLSAPYDYILAELRKYNSTMHIATQYVAGFPEYVRDGIFGNCSTEIVFRIGGKDAKIMAEELTLEQLPRTLQDLPNRQAVIRTLEYDSRINTIRPKGPVRIVMNSPVEPLGDEMDSKKVIEESRKWFSKSGYAGGYTGG
jgi:DNA helicase HerA-like ATPase